MAALDGPQPEAPTPGDRSARPGHLPDTLRQRTDCRAIVRQWRALTGGRLVPDAQRRTLVACSGGADSTALLLALASAAREHVVAAHVLHDLRPEEHAMADQRSVADLCDRLGVPFVHDRVRVRAEPGNAETSARRARYTALTTLAAAQGCRFVATGHQGDDLLETLLMRLVRGAGPRGLAVLAERRPLGGGVELVRPMLALDRSASESICRAGGVVWREDATNADLTRWRARLRADVLPVLRSLRADVSARAAGSVTLLREAADLARREGVAVVDRGARSEEGLAIPREAVDHVGVLVLGEALRTARARLGVVARADRLRWRDVRAIACGLRDADRRTRTWTTGGLVVQADAQRVVLRRA